MKKLIAFLLCVSTVFVLGGFSAPNSAASEENTKPLVTVWDTESGQGKLRITFPPEEEGAVRDDRMLAFLAGRLAESYGTKLTSDQYIIVNE